MADPMDKSRADYILVLCRALEKRAAEGNLDGELADRIERLLHEYWPDLVPAPKDGVKGVPTGGTGVPGANVRPGPSDGDTRGVGGNDGR